MPDNSFNRLSHPVCCVWIKITDLIKHIQSEEEKKSLNQQCLKAIFQWNEVATQIQYFISMEMHKYLENKINEFKLKWKIIFLSKIQVWMRAENLPEFTCWKVKIWETWVQKILTTKEYLNGAGFSRRSQQNVLNS